MDYFFELQSLQLHEIVPLDLLAKNNELEQEPNQVVYYFDSEFYSRPHKLTIDSDGKLIEAMLTIPVSQQPKYKVEMESFGEPEITTLVGDKEKIFSYPSKGLSFLVGVDHQPVKLMKSQPTSKDVYQMEKLSAVPTAPVVLIKDIELTENNVSQSILPVDVLKSPIFYLIFGVSFLVLIFAVIFLRKRKTSQVTQAPQLPQMPPPQPVT